MQPRRRAPAAPRPAGFLNQITSSAAGMSFALEPSPAAGDHGVVDLEFDIQWRVGWTDSMRSATMFPLRLPSIRNSAVRRTRRFPNLGRNEPWRSRQSHSARPCRYHRRKPRPGGHRIRLDDGSEYRDRSSGRGFLRVAAADQEQQNSKSLHRNFQPSWVRAYSLQVSALVRDTDDCEPARG
jgi:hypothetical protein